MILATFRASPGRIRQKRFGNQSRNPEVPIAALAAIAVGHQRVSAIQSTSFGSGSVSGGGGSTGAGSIGGAPVNNSLPPPPHDPLESTQSQSIINIQFLGDVNTTQEDFQETVVGMVNEAIDSEQLLIPTTTRAGIA